MSLGGIQKRVIDRNRDIVGVERSMQIFELLATERRVSDLGGQFPSSLVP